MKKSVVLLTGPGRHGAGNIEDSLIRHGVEVVRICDDRAGRLSKLPREASALAVFDLLPSSVHNAARDLAKAAGIPILHIDRNWSRAAPLFRDAGIIESVEESTLASEEPVTENKLLSKLNAPQQPQQTTQLPSEVMEAVKLLADAMRSNQSVVFVTVGRNGSGFQIDYQVINPQNGSLLL